MELAFVIRGWGRGTRYGAVTIMPNVLQVSQAYADVMYCAV